MTINDLVNRNQSFLLGDNTPYFDILTKLEGDLKEPNEKFEHGQMLGRYPEGQTPLQRRRTTVCSVLGGIAAAPIASILAAIITKISALATIATVSTSLFAIAAVVVAVYLSTLGPDINTKEGRQQIREELFNQDLSKIVSTRNAQQLQKIIGYDLLKVRDARDYHIYTLFVGAMLQINKRFEGNKAKIKDIFGKMTTTITHLQNSSQNSLSDSNRPISPHVQTMMSSAETEEQELADELATMADDVPHHNKLADSIMYLTEYELTQTKLIEEETQIHEKIAKHINRQYDIARGKISGTSPSIQLLQESLKPPKTLFSTISPRQEIFNRIKDITESFGSERVS